MQKDLVISFVARKIQFLNLTTHSLPDVFRVLAHWGTLPDTPRGSVYFQQNGKESFGRSRLGARTLAPHSYLYNFLAQMVWKWLPDVGGKTRGNNFWNFFQPRNFTNRKWNGQTGCDVITSFFFTLLWRVLTEVNTWSVFALTLKQNIWIFTQQAIPIYGLKVSFRGGAGDVCNHSCFKTCVPQVTRQVYNLFQWTVELVHYCGG